MEEVIKKWNIKLETVQDVIKTVDENESVLTAQAVERFIKEFIKDLKSIQSKSPESEICSDCHKYKRSQGNGILHQLCECGSKSPELDESK